MTSIHLHKRYLLIATLLYSLISLSSCIFVPENEDKNIEIGNEIVIALYAYEQVNNQFPAQLDELTPEYLDEIPLTSGNQEFFYSVNKVDNFNLVFTINSHYGCGYTDKLKQWECGYGD